MDTEGAAPVGERPTVSEAAERLIDHLEAYGLKPTTITTYRSLAHTHLARHFPDRDLRRITAADVERMVAAMRRGGAGPKLINNAITLLGQVFDHGIQRGWCTANPARTIRRPRVEQSEAIRFLDQPELEALLRAASSDTDHALFLTAAMTGLRQGELLGLQWRDVDWQAGKLRVRRSYVRGHWGTPKSRRSSRAVPMADRVAGTLDRRHQRTAYKAEDDLVFCHPDRGTVLDHSHLAAGSTERYEQPVYATCAFTISATPSGRAWRRSACPCARFRSGWAIATSRPPSSMRTTPPPAASRS